MNEGSLQPSPDGHSLQATVDIDLSSKVLHQRLLLEELFRHRSAGDYERYVESFRRAAVDLNPYQLVAVAFALRRLDEGEVLLCDEVGQLVHNFLQRLDEFQFRSWPLRSK